MKKTKLWPAVSLVCLVLSSCAPIILGRTPHPVAPEAWEFSMNAGYPLLSPYPNDPLNGPSQVPVAHPLNLFLARGVGGETELNGTLLVSIIPSLRLGGKTLLTSGAFPLAADYGVSLSPVAVASGSFLSTLVVDAGLLFSLPQPGVEPYGALRGFVLPVNYATPYPPIVTGSLTVGADLPLGAGNFFVELTAATTGFETYENPTAPLLPPFGFTIVPALGYRF